jgi:hypothetical protein
MRIDLYASIYGNVNIPFLDEHFFWNNLEQFARNTFN